MDIQSAKLGGFEAGENSGNDQNDGKDHVDSGETEAGSKASSSSSVIVPAHHA